ncbi:MAG: triose-phosphate isomerase [Thaumarchaeota archaeon]|nr:triose-phosphate isomerase [Nitrososphaerota archaeon]
MFVINCKNYEEVTGRNISKLIKIARKVSKKYRVKIAVAPPQHLVGLAASTKGAGDIIILAQHADDSSAGSTTGYIIPELLKKSKVQGTLLNHSERRISQAQIKGTILRLKQLKMISIVCVKDVEEAKIYAKMAPDYIAIEPPELIGSGKAVSKERPDLITDAASAVNATKNNTSLLCGAGIVSGYDVSKALELGADGILVASGIIKSDRWKKTISEFAKSMK